MFRGDHETSIRQLRSSGIFALKAGRPRSPFGDGSGVTVPPRSSWGQALSICRDYPADSSVAVGATQQLTATGTFSDGTTQDVTINAHWSSTVPTSPPSPMLRSARVSQPPSLRYNDNRCKSRRRHATRISRRTESASSRDNGFCGFSCPQGVLAPRSATTRSCFTSRDSRAH